jgi:hypothetical protein
MLARRNSGVSLARTNGNEMTEAARIRRPCNSSFFKIPEVALEARDQSRA